MWEEMAKRHHPSLQGLANKPHLWIIIYGVSMHILVLYTNVLCFLQCACICEFMFFVCIVCLSFLCKLVRYAHVQYNTYL